MVYLADAVGTQTKAVITRGLFLGLPIRAVARRETATSLLIGITLAALFLPFTFLLGDAAVAVTACLALLAALRYRGHARAGAALVAALAGARSRVRLRAARDGAAGSRLDRGLLGIVVLIT